MSLALEVPSFVQNCPPRREAPRAHRRRPVLSYRVARRFALRLGAIGLAYFLLSTGVQPYVQAHRLEAQAGVLEQQVQQEQRQQADLKAQVAELQTTRGQQNAARVYGWVLKGEIPISCPTPDTAFSRMSDAELLARPELPRVSVANRLRHALEW